MAVTPSLYTGSPPGADGDWLPAASGSDDAGRHTLRGTVGTPSAWPSPAPWTGNGMNELIFAGLHSRNPEVVDCVVAAVNIEAM